MVQLLPGAPVLVAVPDHPVADAPATVILT
jgi:hypothetical protein